MAYLDEQTQRINDMYANLKKQKQGELTAQKDQGIEELRRTLAEQLPQYQTARAQADVGQVQNMNRLKEYMASSGAFNSGDNLSRASNVLTQRANAVNQINGNENAFTLGVNNKIADTNNQYNTNVNSINSQLDFEKMKAVEDLRERMRQEELQKQQAETQYQRQLAMQREQQAASLRTAQAKSSGSSSSKSAAAAKKQIDEDKKSIESEFYALTNPTDRERWLDAYQADIIRAAGGGSTGQSYLANLRKNTGKGAVYNYSSGYSLH